jgi:hypothetical protein
MLVGAQVIFLHGADDGGRLWVGLGCVEGLEDPGESIDAEVEEGATGEGRVYHSVGVWEGLLGWDAVAEIGGGAVYGADAAGGYDFADVDGEWEVAGPNLDVVSNVA